MIALARRRCTNRGRDPDGCLASSLVSLGRNHASEPSFVDRMTLWSIAASSSVWEQKNAHGAAIELRRNGFVQRGGLGAVQMPASDSGRRGWLRHGASAAPCRRASGTASSSAGRNRRAASGREPVWLGPSTESEKLSTLLALCCQTPFRQFKLSNGKLERIFQGCNRIDQDVKDRFCKNIGGDIADHREDEDHRGETSGGVGAGP